MSFTFTRRSALAVGGSLLASLRLPSLRAADATLPVVQFRPEIEPLVRLLEDTPRERIFVAVANRIHAGTSYRECMAALFLAAIRNVQPRPAVGFKFHSVLVVNSAHLASMSAVDSERWLPLFWAIDYFKQAQQQDVAEGNWTMAKVDESRLPSATAAEKALRTAMQNWDVEAADGAAAMAARTMSAHQLFDLFAEFGARDFRSIGHKAIYVAGAFRVLEIIGWEHAEPVMRGLAYALLNHTGDPNPAEADLEADRQGRENYRRRETFPRDWLAGTASESAAHEVLEQSRHGSPADMAAQAMAMLNKGVAPSSILDGQFAAAAELVLRQPAIVPLHAMTTANAMHYLYQHAHDDALRRWLLLQSASFTGHFRQSAEARGKLASLRLDDIQPAEQELTMEEVFERNTYGDIGAAAGRVLGYLNRGGDAAQLLGNARHLVFLKGDDAHDYKYSAALMEDYFAWSAPWRDRILAAGSVLLPHAGVKDTDLPQRVQAAFA